MKRSKVQREPGISVHMMVRQPPIERIAVLLEYLSPVVDEIVMLDTGSEDELKHTMTTNWPKIRLFEAPFKDFTTRNVSLPEHRFEWTLHLDWDEMPSHRMMEHVVNVSRGRSEHKPLGWLYLAKNFWAGRPGPYIESNWHTRLWKTGHGKFYKPVHEQVALDGRKESDTRNTSVLIKAPVEAYFIHSKSQDEINRSGHLYNKMDSPTEFI